MRYWFFCSTLVLLLSPARLGAQAPAPAEPFLEGEVVNAVTGAPIAGARIKIATGPDAAIYTRADDRGRFRLDALAPGSYTVSADSPGFLKRSSTNVSIPPSTAAGAASPVKATVQLTPYAVIAGKITDPYGVPVAGCMVEILSKQPVRHGATPQPSARRLRDGQMEIATRLQVFSNDQGEFRAAPLDAGTYYVVTGRPNWNVWDNTYRNTYYPRSTDLASAKPLELAAGQQVRADVQILRLPGVRVAGRIVTPPGQDVSSGASLYTEVTLVPEQSSLLNPIRPSAGAHDAYEIGDVMPGKYTLLASARDLASDPFGGNYKAAFGAVVKVEVGDRDLAGVDVVLQPFRDLAGVVAFPAGCAAVPLRIRFQGHAPFGFGQSETASDAEGKFVLSGLQTGTFTLDFITSQGSLAHVSSMRLGDRDVLNEGLESPYAGGDILRVSVDCPGKEGLR
ncbi:MAG: carboxypeptidase regulatory-like domain-containing protein [Bryobacteraceae bacterium]